MYYNTLHTDKVSISGKDMPDVQSDAGSHFFNFITNISMVRKQIDIKTII